MHYFIGIIGLAALLAWVLTWVARKCFLTYAIGAGMGVNLALAIGNWWWALGFIIWLPLAFRLPMKPPND
ncbi:MAG: hypothetical protein V1838_01555 [Patescibacteria group bacterium]